MLKILTIKTRLSLLLLLFTLFASFTAVELHSQMGHDGSHERPDDRYYEDGYHRENSKTNPFSVIFGVGIMGFVFYMIFKKDK